MACSRSGEFSSRWSNATESGKMPLFDAFRDCYCCGDISSVNFIALLSCVSARLLAVCIPNN